nr:MULTISPECIES: HEAT repeat domain-containing protein [Myxococcaceae]
MRYQALQQLDPAARGALEALLAGLHDESWRVRRIAAEGFARLAAPERAVAPLVAVLGERGETGARNAAAEALVRLGERALPGLRGLLAHADPDQRKFAADILGQLGSARAAPDLVRALADPDLNVRVSVAEALGGVGARDEATAGALRPLLSSPEALLRLAALESLTRLGLPPPLGVVAPLLEDGRLRASAYRALGFVEEPGALPLLARGLASASRAVREAALEALGAQARRVPPAQRGALEASVRGALEGDPQVSARLTEALETGELSVRAGALAAAAALKDPALALPVARAGLEERLAGEVAHALRQLGPEACDALASHLVALPPPARAAVGEVLVEVASPACIGAVRGLLSETEPGVRELAVRALGRSRSLEALPLLLALLSDPDLGAGAGRALQGLSAGLQVPVREALERAQEREPSPAGLRTLGRVGGSGALPLLRRSARSADPALRAAALEAVAELGADGAAELARYALADEAAAVRRAAVRALGRVGSAQAEALLQRALRDEDGGVRMAAVEAAGECGAQGCVPLLQALVAGEDGGLAWAALAALGRLRALSPALLGAAARHPDAEVVKAALEAGAPYTAEVAVLAQGLLGHARWDVRAAAARTLAQHAGAAAGPALEAALAREPDALVREALTQALGRLGRG